jgi:hypothetical protein
MTLFLEEIIINSTNEMTKEKAIERAQHFYENKGLWDAWPLENKCYYYVTCLSVNNVSIITK